jgi:hypothetical protein
MISVDEQVAKWKFLDAEVSYGTIPNQPKIAKIYGEMTQIGARDQVKSP